MHCRSGSVFGILKGFAIFAIFVTFCETPLWFCVAFRLDWERERDIMVGWCEGDER